MLTLKYEEVRKEGEFFNELIESDKIDNELGTVTLMLVLLVTVQLRFAAAIRSVHIGLLFDGVMVGGKLISM